jgi:hypothetical protein
MGSKAVIRAGVVGVPCSREQPPVAAEGHAVGRVRVRPDHGGLAVERDALDLDARDATTISLRERGEVEGALPGHVDGALMGICIRDTD